MSTGIGSLQDHRLGKICNVYRHWVPTGPPAWHSLASTLPLQYNSIAEIEQGFQK